MSPKQSTILVIEDEPSLAAAIVHRLQFHSINTVQTDSGTEALSIIEKRDEPFQAIWLDFDVHDIDGLEFMKRFRDMEKWEEVPVIIVSNTGNPEKIQMTIKLGAKKWIIKAESKLDDIIQQFMGYIDGSIN